MMDKENLQKSLEINNLDTQNLNSEIYDLTTKNNCSFVNDKIIENETNLEDFLSDKRLIINEYNSLKKHIKNQNIWETSIIKRKSIPKNFARCLDFYNNSKNFMINN